jgi:hypothetical protein
MSPVEITPEFNPLRLPSDRRLNRIAGPSALIIFGVTGDLARKKLMPAVYDLANRGLLPPGFALVGFARRDWEDQDFAKVVPSRSTPEPSFTRMSGRSSPKESASCRVSSTTTRLSQS